MCLDFNICDMLSAGFNFMIAPVFSLSKVSAYHRGQKNSTV